MEIGKHYTRIGDLAASIAADVRRLEEGKLPIADLEKLADNARELHERLIVLRHKAREASFPRPVVEKSAPTPQVQPTPVVAPLPAAQEPPPIRLDTAPKQTSLIDAIAETEVPGTKAKEPKTSAPGVKSEPPKAPEPSAAATSAPATKPVASVGEKLGRAPIADLGKAVALSQKFWFVAELFAGDRSAYERAITELNKAPGRAEAKAYVKDEVLSKLKNPPGEDVLAAFNELIERRHR
ncbi:MAG: hypothetical protein WAU70_17550 [Flavobacteriales bacterium]